LRWKHQLANGKKRADKYNKLLTAQKKTLPGGERQGSHEKTLCPTGHPGGRESKN